jgi:hypothetical protein
VGKEREEVESAILIQRFKVFRQMPTKVGIFLISAYILMYITYYTFKTVMSHLTLSLRVS